MKQFSLVWLIMGMRAKHLRGNIMKCLGVITLGFLSAFLCAKSARAQAAAEYGSVSSSMSLKGSNMKLWSTPKPAAKKADKFKYLPIQKHKKDVMFDNLHALELNAGKDAGKVMLRSTPSNALVQVNGKAVGKTPLLLILAPGNYKVDLEGERMETGHYHVDLLPRETRNVVFPLKQRYPTFVKLP